jgi:hypothetical protein
MPGWLITKTFFIFLSPFCTVTNSVIAASATGQQTSNSQSLVTVINLGDIIKIDDRTSSGDGRVWKYTLVVLINPGHEIGNTSITYNSW